MSKELEYAERINAVLDKLGIKQRTLGHYQIARDIVFLADEERCPVDALPREIKHLDNIAIVLDHIWQVLQSELQIREQALDEIKEQRQENRRTFAATCEALRQSN